MKDTNAERKAHHEQDPVGQRSPSFWLRSARTAVSRCFKSATSNGYRVGIARLEPCAKRDCARIAGTRLTRGIASRLHLSFLRVVATSVRANSRKQRRVLPILGIMPVIRPPLGRLDDGAQPVQLVYGHVLHHSRPQLAVTVEQERFVTFPLVARDADDGSVFTVDRWHVSSALGDVDRLACADSRFVLLHGCTGVFLRPLTL